MSAILSNIEFYTDYMSGNAMYKKVGEMSAKELSEKDVEVINELLEVSKAFYPDQYEAVTKEYERSSLNKRYFDFLRARRIISCCFGDMDHKVDIDSNGRFNFEHVKCPLMAECKYHKIICQPKFNSALSDRELEVMKMYFEHVSTDEIAERLFISINTVNNHRKNSLTKLGLHSIDEFIGYAYRNKLFGQ